MTLVENSVKSLITYYISIRNINFSCFIPYSSPLTLVSYQQMCRTLHLTASHTNNMDKQSIVNSLFVLYATYHISTPKYYKCS
jgi:hypothetical protein